MQDLGAGTSLSHYRLLTKIGEGGMGVVWKAEDTILGRTVAIKVLPSDVARDENRRRMFQEEARLASSLSDAHIAQIHELGREGGLDFIVMEFVDGRPLSATVRGRSLQPEEVARLGRQVAHALARAHRKGLLHRDLKPANILVTPEGDAKVVDFGLATLVHARDAASFLTTETAPGVSGASGPSAQETRPRLVGTLAYMSPEQARGEPLDARSDIYALGLVLYEMATGRRPFSAATTTDLLREIQKGRLRPPHELVPKLPADLDRIIVKALAPQRVDRYQTMDDLAVDLKRLGRDLESGSSPSYEEMADAVAQSHRRLTTRRAAAAAAGLLALAAGAWFWGPWRVPAGRERTILIAPFEVQGQDEGAAFLGQAVAESIAVNLAQARRLHVLPVPEIVPAARGAGRARLEAARRAGAGRLLTGSILRSDRMLKASVTLTDAFGQRVVWGVEKEARDDAISAMAAGLAREIAAKMGGESPQLHDSPRNITANPALTVSPDYAAAFGALRSFDVKAALAASERLIASFPAEPEAFVLRAEVLQAAAWSAGSGSPERRAFEEGVSALLRVDPSTPWAGFLRAAFLEIDGRPEQAMDEYGRFLARDDLTASARARALGRRAQARSNLGEIEAALADAREAIRLDSSNPGTHGSLAVALVRAERDDEALVAIRNAIALSPNPDALRWRGYILYRLGRWEEARRSYADSCELYSDQWTCAVLACATHHAGRGEEARTVAARAAGMPATAQGLLALAAFHALEGDTTKALDLLQRCVDYGDKWSPWDYRHVFVRDPDFASIRGEARFKAIAAQAEKTVDAPRSR